MDLINQEEPGIRMLLLDGRNVNLFTREGADAYLLSFGNKNYVGFSANLPNVMILRQKSRPTEQDKFVMNFTYTSFIQISMSASPDIYDTIIPKTELESWFDHVNAVFPLLQNNKTWKRTGRLEEHDYAALSLNAFLVFHQKALQVGFEKGLYKTIASFVESREAPKLPDVKIARTITHIVNNSFASYCFNKKAQTEKFWKKLEASGLLLQYIRCSTYPEIQDDALYVCYRDLLQHNLPLMKKKFRKGTTGGDVLQAILEGRDGSKRQDPKVLRFLRNIVTFAKDSQGLSLMDPPSPVSRHSNVGTGDLKMCQHCKKMDSSKEFQASIMKCSRCRTAYYCSKECQAKDWKSHKPSCLPIPTKHLKKSCAASKNNVSCPLQLIITFLLC